jgi:G3E family GTPase
MQRPGTVVVEHRFDGHVVRRTTAMLRRDELTTAEAVLELAHGCVACTIRNDLLVYLRMLHRRSDVQRIVVGLASDPRHRRPGRKVLPSLRPAAVGRPESGRR